jgi:hypothetical protein
MVIVNLKGGLGNYLFQIAAGYVTTLKYNTDYSIDTSKIMQIHSHIDVYRNNMFRSVPIGNNLPIHSHYHYDSLSYRDIRYSDNMLLDGYFQSEKYWSGLEDKVKELFSIDENTLKYLTDKYNTILNDDNTCSIHVRRGDYLNIDIFNKLDYGYYNNAIDIVGRNKHFIIFSNDIQWCKNNFNDINATFIEDEADYVDLYLMSLCKHNIIANSTFSWWGAYLNNNKDKIVIGPNTWFLHSHSNQDILPDTWTKI